MPPPGGALEPVRRAARPVPHKKAADRGSWLRVWRLKSRRRAGQAFDGEGARLYGGRWNFPGTPLVYTSSTLSLCALEYFVHLEPALAPLGLVAVAAGLPPDLEIPSLPLADLPADWRRYPAPSRLQEIGSTWVREGLSAVLRVPSAIIPDEQNVLLNPLHPDFRRLRLHPPQPFAFDPRMWK
jgi:RES domain-containing protein